MLREWVEPNPPPVGAPPEEMAGPLLVYLLTETESRVGDHGTEPWYRRYRVIVHDTATVRAWQVIDRLVPFEESTQLRLRLWTTRQGLIVEDDTSLTYVAPDGTTTAPLIEGISEREGISELVVTPNGARVAVLLSRDERPEDYIHGGEGYGPVSYRLLLYGLPSAQLLAAETLSYPGGVHYISNRRADQMAFAISIDAYDVAPFAGVFYLSEAAFRTPPEGVLSPGHLSADFRYAARVWIEELGRYRTAQDYYSKDEGKPGRLEIIEYETGRVLWSEHVGFAHSFWLWTWAAPDHFAWASGDIPDLNAEGAEVSLLTVSTGEIELIDSTEFVERFRTPVEDPAPVPEPRATVECRDDPGQPCQVLLDGEVVGEGRWAEIIGFIELD